MNILDTPVSCFNSVRSSEPSCIVNLLEWVTTDIYKSEIEKLRKMQSKKHRDNAKKNLPAITPSGVFEPKRHIDNLRLHSGIISIDIDQKDNEKLCADIDRLKARISTIPEVAYCGLSASGKGIYVLIPITITSTATHKVYFEKLKDYFHKAWGIAIDKACGDVTRLRCISYDSNYYLNNQAVVFNTLPVTTYANFNETNSGQVGYLELKGQLHKILRPVLENGIDITNARGDWFKLCSVIVNASGDSGRDLFHTLSSFYPKYNQKECDALYDDLLKRPPYNYGLGTIVHIVKQYI